MAGIHDQHCAGPPAGRAIHQPVRLSGLLNQAPDRSGVRADNGDQPPRRRHVSKAYVDESHTITPFPVLCSRPGPPARLFFPTGRRKTGPLCGIIPREPAPEQNSGCLHREKQPELQPALVLRRSFGVVHPNPDVLGIVAKRGAKQHQPAAPVCAPRRRYAQGIA